MDVKPNFFQPGTKLLPASIFEGVDHFLIKP